VRATPASVELALSALEKKWPYSIRFVLVALNDDDALDTAFSLGANEVLRKPIRPSELLARLRVRLKDAADLKRVHQLSIGDVIIDQKSRKIHRGELSSQLSQLSFDVLMCLADMPKLVVPRLDIKRRGWRDIHVADGSLDRQMHELRRCLSDLGSELAIKAVYGEGYMLS
jgi:two-component system OmpR family response regulator